MTNTDNCNIRFIDSKHFNPESRGTYQIALSLSSLTVDSPAQDLKLRIDAARQKSAALLERSKAIIQHCDDLASALRTRLRVPMLSGAGRAN